jgi:hypothetical protein
VAYSEMVHTTAFQQPQHVFKVGRMKGSNVRETFYFRAKSESEKQSWVDAIERAVHLAGTKRPCSECPRSPSKKCDLVSWDLVATLNPEWNLFCALRDEEVESGSRMLFGTSHGLVWADGGGTSVKEAEGCVDAEPIFHMEVVSELNKILAIRGTERKLFLSNSLATLSPWTPMTCIDACHLFAVGRGAIHQLLNIILKLKILVLLPVSTMPYVVKVKNYS